MLCTNKHLRHRPIPSLSTIDTTQRHFAEQSMAREEDLKKIELKVSVDCCDGCKRKVLKALSIKGVLKMEIHPTEPLVTVTGNVNAETLVKRLAKYGKLAEVLPVVDKKQEKGDKKMENAEGSGKDKEKEKDGKGDKKVAFEHEKNSKCCEANKSGKAEKVDAEKVDKITKGTASCSENNSARYNEEALRGMNPGTTISTTAAAAVTTPLPEMNCIINPGMMHGAIFTQASVPRVYYPMEQYMVPVTYPMPNTFPANTYPASTTMMQPNTYPQNMYQAGAALIPPPYYCCHDPQHHHHHSSAHSGPPRMTDYFNDDNTASCSIM